MYRSVGDILSSVLEGLYTDTMKAVNDHGLTHTLEQASRLHTVYENLPTPTSYSRRDQANQKRLANMAYGGVSVALHVATDSMCSAYGVVKSPEPIATYGLAALLRQALEGTIRADWLLKGDYLPRQPKAEIEARGLAYAWTDRKLHYLYELVKQTHTEVGHERAMETFYVQWKEELSPMGPPELWRSKESPLPILTSVPKDIELSRNADQWDGVLTGRLETYCLLSGLAHGASWALRRNPMAVLSVQTKMTNTYVATPPFEIYSDSARLIIDAISKSLLEYRRHLIG